MSKEVFLGKPDLEYTSSTNGMPSGSWTTIDTPKEDSTSMETSEGNDVEAKEEGGEVVGRISATSTYAVSFELFKKAGEAFPLADKENRGVINGEYALRVTSGLMDGAPGYQIDRATIKTAKLYAPNDTYRKKYTFNALKPAYGDAVKDIERMTVNLAASATSGTATLVEANTAYTADGFTAITVSGFDGDSSFTATASGTTLSIVCTANASTTTEKVGEIVVRGDSTVHIIKVVQAAASASSGTE